MSRNFFKTAYRSLRHNKAYAVINVMGLAVGIAAAVLIFLVIQYETSFDNFHANGNNIYRICSQFHTEDGVGYSAGVAFPVGPALRADFPQLKQVASIFRRGGEMMVDDNGEIKKFDESDVFFAEPQFFQMFNFGWLAGNPRSALIEPNTAVLTQAMAEKYFGDWRNAIGKTIKEDRLYMYKITGVIKNVPVNTDFPLGIVVSYSTMQNMNLARFLNDWVASLTAAYTFAVVPAGLSATQFNTQLSAFAKKHKPAEYVKDTYILQPLKEMHYDERFGNYRGHTFSHLLINVLTLIGIFLVVVACVNFVNLATAQAVNRSKEVGVRKVLGGGRSKIVFQFLSETAVVTLIALALAAGLAVLVLPFLNQLLEVKMTADVFANSSLLIFMLITGVSVTLLSGIYPAIVWSRFNPVTALKSKITTKQIGGISLRRALVVLQFSISHILVIGMLVIASQLDYFKNAPLGFDRTEVINVPLPGDSLSHTKTGALRNALLANTNISNVSFSFSAPSTADEDNWTSDFKYDHADKPTNFSASLKWADADYFKTYDLKFIAGRAYYPSDDIKEFVVSEDLLKKLGIRNPQEALGKQIEFWNGAFKGTVVGVIKDFNSGSLRAPLAPVILSTWNAVYKTISIKIKHGAENAALPYIENVWTGTFPDYVYQYKFLDETIANLYKQENRLSVLYKIFAGIAIFISCLGLYGLVSFMAVQRTKEVGIRKVLGASVKSIVYLFSKEFTVLIAIAFLVAAPVAWYMMNDWLSNFAYRIQITAGIFALAIVISIMIAWITVGYESIRAATANPVESLRTE